MDNPFAGLFSRLMGNPDGDTKYEPVAPLSTKDNQEWEKLLSDFEKAKSRMVEVEAKKKLFWIKIERKLNLYDKSLRIENGMVLAEVEHKSNCSVPGERLAIPGFCNGDCANCSQKPEVDEEDEG